MTPQDKQRCMLNKKFSTKFPFLKNDGDNRVTCLKYLTVTAKRSLRRHDN